MSGLFLPILLVLAACTPPPPRTPAHVVPPTLTPTATARRVVLLSFDGLGADELARQAGLAAFDHLAQHGATARVIPVNPTVTSSTHIAILTGADPQRSGVVSNRFHMEGSAPREVARGMKVEIDVESLVEAARRQGKRVGAVSFPGVDAASPRRSADFGLVWTDPLVPGRAVKLTRTDFRREWVPPTWTDRPRRRQSFSPIMRARLDWSVPNSTLRSDVDIVAYDTSADGAENYDLYVVEREEQEIATDEQGWFSLSKRNEDGLHGSWSKIEQHSPSLDVTLYWGPISRTQAYPDSFRSLLDEEAGFWPGSPDEAPWVDPTTYAQQVARLVDFYTRAQTTTIRRVPFDLLLAYQSQIDEVLHNFLGRPGGEAVIRDAFVASDRAVAAIGSLLDVSRDVLIVTGDHGVMPSRRGARPNRMLAEAGLAPQWRAYVSGSVAHLYRFSGEDNSDTVVALLTSSGLFERVEKKTPTWHRRSGDIMAYAYPEVALHASDDPPAIGEPESAGHHGGLNTHPELHPILLAHGVGIPGGDFGEVSQTRIARFVSQLLGIAPPAGAE